MKINTNSWHFWLWKFTHTFTDKCDYQIEEPTSLWRYIGRLILLPIPTVCLMVLMAITAIAVVVIIGGGAILLRNLYTILTLQGISWFDPGSSDKVFKWIWEFKRINQKPWNASWLAKFFWINLILSEIISGLILYLDYHQLIPYLWLIVAGQVLVVLLSYFLGQYVLKLSPRVYFIDPEDEDHMSDEFDFGEEDGDSV